MTVKELIEILSKYNESEEIKIRMNFKFKYFDAPIKVVNVTYPNVIILEGLSDS